MKLNYLIGKKILVTGGAGFLGSHVAEVLKENGISSSSILIPRSKQVDFRNAEAAMKYVQQHRPDVIISLAARLGGIGDNRAYPASYFYDNLMIGINTIEAARYCGVQKLVLIGTVCSYPKVLPAPFREDDLWNGFPEETNAPYGVSKKAVGLYAQAVKQQHGLNAVNLLLTNLYGPGDDFREQTSHVIPAIIKKVWLAKKNNDPHIVAWGDGSPSRDFVYVRDAAQGIVLAAEHHNDAEPVNIGSGVEVRVKDLIETICRHLNYNGEIVWDTSKPNGQPRRLLDISRAQQLFHYSPAVSFSDGLKKTIEWFEEHEEAIRNLPAKYGS